MRALQCTKLIVFVNKTMSTLCLHNECANADSSKEWVQYIHKILTQQEVMQKHTGFQFDDFGPRNMMNFVSFFDNLNKNMSSECCTICSECLIGFWSNSPALKVFVYLSSACFMNTVPMLKLPTHFNSIMFKYMAIFQGADHVYGKPYEIEALEQYSWLTVTLIQVTKLWHIFMLQPQFLKYYLLKKNVLFKVFLQFWYTILELYLAFNTASDGFDDTFTSRTQLKNYLFGKWTDILFYFCCAIQYLKKKRLQKTYVKKYIGKIQSIANKINVQHPMRNKFQRCLKLILEQLNGVGHTPDMGHYLTNKIKCGNVGHCTIQTKSDKHMKLCSQCKSIYYCSRKCQKWHWKHKHRLNCLKIVFDFNEIKKYMPHTFRNS
eukprot:478681_1